MADIFAKAKMSAIKGFHYLVTGDWLNFIKESYQPFS